MYIYMQKELFNIQGLFFLGIPIVTIPPGWADRYPCLSEGFTET